MYTEIVRASTDMGKRSKQYSTDVLYRKRTSNEIHSQLTLSELINSELEI